MQTLMHVLFVSVVLCALQVPGHTEPLYQSLSDFVSSKTRPHLLPQTDPNKPLDIDILMGVIDIEKVDGARNEVWLRTWFSAFWNSSITWDPKDYNGLTKIALPGHRVYVPRIMSSDSCGHYETLTSFDAVFKNDGFAVHTTKMRWCFLCDLSAGKEKEKEKDGGDDGSASSTSATTCSVRMHSGEYINDVVHFRDPAKFPIDVNKFMAQFRFPGSKYTVTSESYATGSENLWGFDWVTFKFTFEKKRAELNGDGPVAIFRWP